MTEKQEPEIDREAEPQSSRGRCTRILANKMRFTPIEADGAPYPKSAARHLARNAGEITLLDADVGAIPRAHALQHGKRVAIGAVIAAAGGKINQKAHGPYFLVAMVQQARG